MYLTQNPVLQHELLSNLRSMRSVVLLAAYVGLLGGVVLLAWPQQAVLDLAQPEVAKRLVDLFFLGQFFLASMMAPSFAAGAITGEKERQSFEMLLASPLRPGAIVLGKLTAALLHLGILMICSLPIVMLCLPLGGVSAYEVLGAYLAMLSAVTLFGMISLWASSYFGRTSSSLLVSYLIILPLALLGVLAWNAMQDLGGARLLVVATVVPAACLSMAALFWVNTTRRLLHPAHLGAGGKEAIDLETESREVVGLYLNPNDFPDMLFVPAKRTDFLPEGANPIYDKEMRSEIIAQGTLMLRLVIMISMVIDFVVMAVCVFLMPHLVAWHVAYVLLFNMLVGPVFSAGSVCSERERQTLDLLLTTLITSWQMLWGKLLSGLRVSSVLTALLLWPLLIACLIPFLFWGNLPTICGYFTIVGLTCLTTSLTALFCSTFFRKTSTSLIASYVAIVVMFGAPLAANFFAQQFYRDTPAARVVKAATATSPFAAAFALPLDIDRGDSGNAAAQRRQAAGEPWLFFGYLGWSAAYNATLLLLLIWLFRSRWRVAE